MCHGKRQIYNTQGCDTVTWDSSTHLLHVWSKCHSSEDSLLLLQMLHFFFLIIHCYPHATVGHWRAILFHFTFVCVCALCVLYCVLGCVVCEKIQCNLFINFKHKILFWLDLLLKKYSIQHVAMEKINKNVNIKITGKKNNHKCHNTLEK